MITQYCLTDCGDDAHPHVAACEFSTRRGEYFNTKEGFEEVQRERRFKMLWEYLETMEPTEREEALVELQPAASCHHHAVRDGVLG